MSLHSMRLPLILILSLALWSPVVSSMMGAQEIAAGIMRYLAALALSWVGVTGIVRLIDHYAALNHREEEPAAPLTAEEVAEGLAQAGETFHGVLSDSEAA